MKRKFSNTANVNRKTVDSSGIWEYLVHWNWFKGAQRSQWLDSWTGRAADGCSRRFETNHARVNRFSVHVSSVRKSWNFLFKLLIKTYFFSILCISAFNDSLACKASSLVFSANEIFLCSCSNVSPVLAISEGPSWYIWSKTLFVNLVQICHRIVANL